MLGAAPLVVSARRKNVLAASRRRVVIVDDENDAVLLVEDGIADGTRQAIVPEATIAHYRDRPLAGFDIEGRVRGRPQAIAHGRRANIERRHDREEVATDISADM